MMLTGANVTADALASLHGTFGHPKPPTVKRHQNPLSYRPDHRDAKHYMDNFLILGMV